MNCSICGLKWHRPEQHDLPPAPKQETCVWTEDHGNGIGIWYTTCSGAFTLEDGTPTNNKMRFCCYCGKPLKEGRDEGGMDR